MRHQQTTINLAKNSMIRILNALGFASIDDKTTIIPADSFERLDSELVMAAVREYRISFWDADIIATDPPADRNDSPRSNMTAETKFETINRILELKHEMIIDRVKDFDGIESADEHGYRLESMPAGY